MTVSLDTDTLIAACQGAAWKISGWPDNIAIHHTKGCACCHEYINHLLRAQSLAQINLQHINVENAVQSAWPAFINSIEIDADQHMQGQISDLHVQIDELKDALCNAKKSVMIHSFQLIATRSSPTTSLLSIHSYCRPGTLSFASIHKHTLRRYQPSVSHIFIATINGDPYNLSQTSL